MNILQQKEELENKINKINSYWKDLETTYQKELKRREEEYEKNEKENKKTNEHIYLFKEIYILFKM